MACVTAGVDRREQPRVLVRSVAILARVSRMRRALSRGVLRARTVAGHTGQGVTSTPHSGLKASAVGDGARLAPCNAEGRTQFQELPGLCSPRGSSRGRNRQAGVRQKIGRKSPGRLAIDALEFYANVSTSSPLPSSGTGSGSWVTWSASAGLGERAHLSPVLGTGDVALRLRQGADMRAVRAFGRNVNVHVLGLLVRRIRRLPGRRARLIPVGRSGTAWTPR